MVALMLHFQRLGGVISATKSKETINNIMYFINFIPDKITNFNTDMYHHYVFGYVHTYVRSNNTTYVHSSNNTFLVAF